VLSVIASLGTKNYSIQKCGEVQFLPKGERRRKGGERGMGGNRSLAAPLIKNPIDLDLSDEIDPVWWKSMHSSDLSPWHTLLCHCIPQYLSPMIGHWSWLLKCLRHLLHARGLQESFGKVRFFSDASELICIWLWMRSILLRLIGSIRFLIMNATIVRSPHQDSSNPSVLWRCEWLMWKLNHQEAPTLLCSLLYLISKCMHAIGRNCVTWRSLNHTSALTRH